jgi:hypothetical protein
VDADAVEGAAEAARDEDAEGDLLVLLVDFDLIYGCAAGGILLDVPMRLS